MKNKALRWAIYVVVGLILIVVAAVLLSDPIAKSVAEKRVKAETGMETKIGKFSIGWKTATIQIENFSLINPERFGGDTFVEMPELFVEYDRPALRNGKLRLKLVRINVAKVHVVENKDGSRNVDELQKHQGKTKSTKDQKPSNPPVAKKNPPFVFDGVETLDVTLQTVRFTSQLDSNRNMERNLGIEHEVFKNLKTEQDFQTATALLALKAGASFLLGGELTNPLTVLKQGSKAGKETKNILEEITTPENPQKTNR